MRRRSAAATPSREFPTIDTLLPGRISPARALALQRELRSRVRLCPLNRRIRRVAGADVSVGRGDRRLVAGLVVLDFPSLEPVEARTRVSRVRFPYVPGLLSFRELPAIARLFAELRERPDLLILDGHGLAHPRRFGLACHAGVVLDVPTIGCAKTPFVGEWSEPGKPAGCHGPITLEGEEVGVVYRTRADVKVVFLSPGHRCDVPSILRVIPRLCAGYRIPEPTRLAHQLVGRARARAAFRGG
jgi:deoxyribonuclease V